MKRAYARIAGPGEDQAGSAAHADHLIVDEVGRHADKGETAAALADKFVARGKGDQVSESLKRNGVAVVDKSGDRFPQ